MFPLHPFRETCIFYCTALCMDWIACFLVKGLYASPTALQAGVLTCVPAVGRRASQPVIIIH